MTLLYCSTKFKTEKKIIKLYEEIYTNDQVKKFYLTREAHLLLIGDHMQILIVILYITSSFVSNQEERLHLNQMSHWISA